ncbi:MAG: ribonuclease E inhibitor RraB [Burkholderiales bacterium]|nr:ribonuclease E inhibitor RraB [Burkholderiales bacterium]
MPGFKSVIAVLALIALTGIARAQEGVAAAQDRAAIEAMRAQGMDMAEPQTLEFAFYFPEKQGARRVMGALAADGFSGELRTEGVDAFILFARKTMRVDLETLSGLRAQFEALAREAGGSYDGWGLP